MKIETKFVVNYLNIDKLPYSIHNFLDKTDDMTIKGESTEMVPFQFWQVTHTTLLDPS